ncbi:MAG: NAD(P)H-dependent oxidoreductase, partial [Zoogloea sp.]|nr:NAD(P)H-dependent oxidoreductase [Zoogloea sp.]
MTTLLKINASLFSTQGQSSQLAERFVAARLAATPDLKVVSRDLAAEPVPHLDAARFLSFLAKPEERSAEQQAVVAYSDALIEEVRQADEIVIGLPMYNFGVPSTLKAWFDHIARAGVTFRYTATGPEGLLTGKKVTVFAARGGLYAGTPKDSQTTYVRDFLGFIGITDVEFVYAEGLNMGEESKSA